MQLAMLECILSRPGGEPTKIVANVITFEI